MTKNISFSPNKHFLLKNIECTLVVAYACACLFSPRFDTGESTVAWKNRRLTHGKKSPGDPESCISMARLAVAEVGWGWENEKSSSVLCKMGPKNQV